MDLTTMRILVRRNLHDEDANNYRWTNDELDCHVAHAVNVYSNASPLEQSIVLPTTPGSLNIDISSLDGRVNIEAVEYPVDNFPPSYQRFSIRENSLQLMGNKVPDGSNARIYYGRTHILTTQVSTIPAHQEDMIATGACGYAAIEMAIDTINKVNTGGVGTTKDLQVWGAKKLSEFQAALKKADSRNRLRVRTLYRGEES